jgi:glycolate oxidase
MATALRSIPDAALGELRSICGEAFVLTDRSARFNRARVSTAFPVHRWADFVPDVVVLPATAAEVSDIVRLANAWSLPVVPRAGGTGISDGARPLRGGILVDIKRMDQILEVDLANRTATVQPGVNMRVLTDYLRPFGLIYPDQPGSYSQSLIGGRIGTNGWSMVGGRYGHPRDLVVSFEMVLPTGDIVRVGDGGGKSIRKSSSGYQLATEATVEVVTRPECELPAYFAVEDWMAGYRVLGTIAHEGVATLSRVFLYDGWRLEYPLSEPLDFISPGQAVPCVGFALHGIEEEVRGAGKRLMRVLSQAGGRYLGDEVSRFEWASRYDRYIQPLHLGRARDGQVIPMYGHAQDAAIPYSELPTVRQKYEQIVRSLSERHEVFLFEETAVHPNGAFRAGGDYNMELRVGIWEQRLNDESWAAWVKAKRDLAIVAIEHGGSISNGHGTVCDGEVDVLPLELGHAFEVMKKIKRTLDPNNVMNPGKMGLDAAYESESRDDDT